METTGIQSGITELMFAVSTGDPGQVARVLSGMNGKNIDQKDSLGWTALHYAAQHGKILIVSALLGAGANPHVPNGDRDTPQELARKAGHIDIMMQLAKAEKTAPKIKPEDLPEHVVELERMVREMRQQIEELTAPKSTSHKCRKTKRPQKNYPKRGHDDRKR